VQQPGADEPLSDLGGLDDPGIRGRRYTAMSKQISLCPHCDHCPTVEITDQEVHIGEVGNLVKLTPAEWNVLLQAIKTGELAEL
jgi:hypothetical protein